MIVSGLRAHDSDTQGGLGFRMVVGKGTFVIPGLQTVRRLSLDLHEAEFTLRCVTHQGIPIGVRAVVIYKIADDYQSIANAARRFLDQQQQIDQKVHTVFAGHLRSIVGSITARGHDPRPREADRADTRTPPRTRCRSSGSRSTRSRSRRSRTRPGTSRTSPGPSRRASTRRPASRRRSRTARRPSASRRPTRSRRTRRSSSRDPSGPGDGEGCRGASPRGAGRPARGGDRPPAGRRRGGPRIAELEAPSTRASSSPGPQAGGREAYQRRVLAEAEREARILHAEAEARELKVIGEAVRRPSVRTVRPRATRPAHAGSRRPTPSPPGRRPCRSTRTPSSASRSRRTSRRSSRRPRRRSATSTSSPS